MNVLDVRTLLLVVGALYVFLPLSIWLVLRMPRSPAAVLWCGGGMLGGVGFLLMGARGFIPDAASYLIGQPMLVLAALLSAQSLRIDLGRPWRWWLVVLPVVGYGALLAWLLPWLPVSWLGVLIRAVNLLSILTVVVIAWQVGRAEGSRNAKTISMAYAVQALGVCINLMLALRGSTDIQTLSGGLLNVVSFSLMLLVALTSALSYLGLALERLARSNEALVRQAARNQHWNDRRQALLALERQRTLSVLADSIGHSLAQPLSAGLLRVQMAQRDLDSPAPDVPWIGQQVDHLVNSLHHTSDVIEQIRHLIKPEAGTSMPVDLRDLLRDAERLLHQEALNQSIALNVCWPAEAPRVVGDFLQLLQALMQLVRNAMAAVAAAERKEVRLSVSCRDSDVVIHVEDSGPGLAPDVAAMQWDAQAMPTLQGMGLYVVHSIVRHHGGTLMFSDSSLGGAQVGFTLPRYTDQ